jgi:hypothetical protein
MHYADFDWDPMLALGIGAFVAMVVALWRMIRNRKMDKDGANASEDRSARRT